MVEDLNNEFHSQPVLMHAEPVLAVSDIEATVSYWYNTLGFSNKWTWGNPPNHGGVSRDGVFIQFSLEPELASSSKGNSIWIRVRNIEALYELHKKRNASIAAPMEEKPWGMVQYTLKDLNGYYVHFSAPSLKTERSNKSEAEIELIQRTPTPDEYRMLSLAVGWGGGGNEESLQLILSAPIFSLVAEDVKTRNAVGCVLLLGDGVSFYYVKDLMVHPTWQCHGVGTKLMERLDKWIQNNVGEHAFIGLYTGEKLSKFYQQFGFTPMFGMTKRITSTRP